MSSYLVPPGGQRLDLLCWRHYGHLKGSVEAVLAANWSLPDRAAASAWVPAATALTLPELPPPARGLIRLW